MAFYKKIKARRSDIDRFMRDVSVRGCKFSDDEIQTVLSRIRDRLQRCVQLIAQTSGGAFFENKFLKYILTTPIQTVVKDPDDFLRNIIQAPDRTFDNTIIRVNNTITMIAMENDPEILDLLEFRFWNDFLYKENQMFSYNRDPEQWSEIRRKCAWFWMLVILKDLLAEQRYSTPEK